MKSICFLITPILLGFNMAFTQEKNCQNQILDYSSFIETDSTQWHLFLKSKYKDYTLVYFGAEHTKNQTHQQYKTIDSLWNLQYYDIVLFEGPDRGVMSTKNETIEKLGESGFLRFLASKDSVKTQSLEPSSIDEIEYLLNYFSAEKIKLFYLLREAKRVRESLNYGEKKIKTHIEKLLVKANTIPQLNNTILTIGDLELAFVKYWGNKIPWWEAPPKWFDPLLDSKITGGIYTNDINKHSSHFRDIHMYQIISKLLLDDKKVFAVVGRNHIPMQYNAVLCKWNYKKKN